MSGTFLAGMTISTAALITAGVLVSLGKAKRFAVAAAVVAGATLPWPGLTRFAALLVGTLTGWVQAAFGAVVSGVGAVAGDPAAAADAHRWVDRFGPVAPWMIAAGLIWWFCARWFGDEGPSRVTVAFGLLVPALVAGLPGVAGAVGGSVVETLVGVAGEALRAVQDSGSGGGGR